MRAAWAKGAVLGLISMTAPVALLPTPAADADTTVSISAGWWTEARTLTGDPIVPPDVPSDGLYAQNTIPGAGSEAAIGFEASTKVKSLTVHLEPSSVVSQPPLACVLLEPFVPTQAGAWDDRPDYDCTDPVAGTLSEDGTTAHLCAEGAQAEGRRSRAGPGHRSRPTRGGRATGRGRRGAGAALRFERTQGPGSEAAGRADAGPSSRWRDSTSCPPGLHPSRAPSRRPRRPGTCQQAPPQTDPAPAPNTQETPVAAPVIDDDPWRRTLGVWLGLALALGCLVYWADGFGAIPLRRTRWLRDARRTDVGRLGGAT